MCRKIISDATSTCGTRLVKPTDNGAMESLNDRLREECLNALCFLSLADAKAKILACCEDYNESRPHSALHWETLAEFTRHRRLHAVTAMHEKGVAYENLDHQVVHVFLRR